MGGIIQTFPSSKNSGGLEVIANPTEEATDVLNKIQIDDSVYATNGVRCEYNNENLILS